MENPTQINKAEASQMNRDYLQILDDLIRQLFLLEENLRRLLNEQEKNSLPELDNATPSDNPTIQGLSIEQGQNLVYARDEQGETIVNSLTPELVGQLQTAKVSPIGQEIPGANSLTVKYNEHTLLQTDAQGIVQVNAYSALQQNRVNNQVVTQLSEELNSTRQPVANMEESWLNQFLGENEVKIELGSNLIYASDKQGKTLVNHISPELIEQIETALASPIGRQIPGANSLAVKQNEKTLLQTDSQGIVQINAYSTLQQNRGKTQPGVSNGLDVTRQSVTQMEPSTLKQFLGNIIDQVEVIKQQATAQNQQINRLIEERIEEPRNIKWWSEAKEKQGENYQNAQAYLEQSDSNIEVAKTLRSLFLRETTPEQNSYHAEGYTLTRDENHYTLTNSNDQKLFTFRSTAVGVTVEENNLDNSHYQDLGALRAALDNDSPIKGQFAQYGTEEINYFQKVSEIANRLTDYARSKGEKVETVGQNYAWMATPDGNVLIEDLKSDRALFARFNGKTVSNLTERDMSFFENALSQLEASQNQSVQQKQAQQNSVATPSPIIKPQQQNTQAAERKVVNLDQRKAQQRNPIKTQDQELER